MKIVLLTLLCLGLFSCNEDDVVEVYGKSYDKTQSSQVEGDQLLNESLSQLSE